MTKKEKEMRLEHYNMINEELAFAKAKHPKFCEVLTKHKLSDVNLSLGIYRMLNLDDQRADNILEEEIHEALSAYLEGDYDHALQEFAQCGAVILRMMEFVQNEKEGK